MPGDAFRDGEFDLKTSLAIRLHSRCTEWMPEPAGGFTLP